MLHEKKKTSSHCICVDAYTMINRSKAFTLPWRTHQLWLTKSMLCTSHTCAFFYVLRSFYGKIVIIFCIIKHIKCSLWCSQTISNHFDTFNSFIVMYICDDVSFSYVFFFSFVFWKYVAVCVHARQLKRFMYAKLCLSRWISRWSDIVQRYAWTKFSIAHLVNREQFNSFESILVFLFPQSSALAFFIFIKFEFIVYKRDHIILESRISDLKNVYWVWTSFYQC